MAGVVGSVYESETKIRFAKYNAEQRRRRRFVGGGLNFKY